jgi:hypothetical protein
MNGGSLARRPAEPTSGTAPERRARLVHDNDPEYSRI